MIAEAVASALLFAWLLFICMVLIVLPFVALYLLFAALAKVAGWMRRGPPVGAGRE